MVLWLRSSICYLTGIIPLPCSTKWENEEICLSDLFTYISFRTSFHGNVSLFVMQYSSSVFDRGWGGGREIQEDFKEILWVFFLTHFHSPCNAFLRFLRNLILQPQPFSSQRGCIYSPCFRDYKFLNVPFRFWDYCIEDFKIWNFDCILKISFEIMVQSCWQLSKKLSTKLFCDVYRE